jgi:hypothetical protein
MISVAFGMRIRRGIGALAAMPASRLEVLSAGITRLSDRVSQTPLTQVAECTS